MVSDSDKIIVTRYPPLPSVCCICNRSSNGEREYVDFQMSLDIYGAVVICTECMAPVAQTLGYVKESELENLGQDHSQLLDRVEELEDVNERLNSTLDSLLNLRPLIGGNDPATNEVTVEVTKWDADQPELPIGESGTGDSGSSESTSKRGPENVSQPSLNL